MSTTPAAALSHFGIHVTTSTGWPASYARARLLVMDRGKLEGGNELCFLSHDPTSITSSSGQRPPREAPTTS